MSHFQLQIGAKPFPGYCLRELRGKGGFAEVWEADSPDGQIIAMKFFATDQTSSTVKELKSLLSIQKLSHPNLIKIHRIWSMAGYVVVAMELAEGSLMELLTAYQTEFQANIEHSLLCHFLGQAAEALDYLNARQHTLDGRKVGWQHCDIKPSNLLLFGEDLKIADFGFATPTTSSLNPYLTGGTLDFAPPEVFRGMVSERSDQYSLAVTYYYLRTSQFPFPSSPKKFSRDYSYSRPHPKLDLVDIRERKIIERALAINPSDRWESCRQFVQELSKVNCSSSSNSLLVATNYASRSDTTCDVKPGTRFN